MATPPSKRYCSDLFDCELELECTDDILVFPCDVPSLAEGSRDLSFYPSEDSNQQGSSNDVCTDHEDSLYFYPSEESNQQSETPASCNTTQEELADTHADADSDSLDATIVDGCSAEESNELKRIGELLVGLCCKKLCLRHLTATDVIASRSNFLQLNKTEQRQYLFTKLKESSCEAGHKVETKYFIAGKEICNVAWAKVYSISQRTLTRMLKSISLGESKAAHGNQGKRRVNTKKESVGIWMERYFHLIGDKMPNSSQIHLPSWEVQKDVYSRYCQDMQIRGIPEDEIAGISVFYKIWTEEFSHVVIPEVCT